MKIVVANDRNDLGRYTAEKAAEILRTRLQDGNECNLVVATGSSQFEVLEHLVQQPGIDWNRVNGFHLDEYLGIDQTHPASFCGYLATRFVEKVPLKSFHFMTGTTPPDELKAAANALLADRQVDLLLCGIGENGHLAFNDPPADFDTTESYIIVDLDEACRKQQVGEGWFDSFDEVPTQAISMTVHQILRADHIICAVPDRRKAEAVKATVQDEISPEIPASKLREHAQTTLVIDASSSSLLDADVLADCHHLDAASS